MSIDDLVEATTAALESAAREGNIFMSGDCRVSEADAAALLGYSPNHFRQLRAEGKGPPAYMLGLNGSRISYRIRDLAIWIESRRENFED